MKKIFKTIVVALCFIGVVGSLGFGITLLRYTIEKPVAEVQMIRVCRTEGGNSYWGGYNAGDNFANVRILKIYDPAEFEKTVYKISEDGHRANVAFAPGYSEEGQTYKCYGRDSMRGRGINGWWNNFGFYWNKANFALVGVALLALLLLVAVLTIKSDNKS